MNALRSDLLAITKYWVIRDIKTRYAGSLLGVLWAIIQPLSTVFLFYVIFGLIIEMRMPGAASPHGYFLYLCVSFAVWMPMSDSLLRSSGAIVAYEDFLKKQPVPVAILPISVVLAGAVPVMALYAVALTVVAWQVTSVGWTWLAIPLIILVQLAMTAGLSLFLSMSTYLWRDFGAALSFLFQAIFYLTPVIYPLSQIPSDYQVYYLINPFALLIFVLQDILLNIAMPDHTLPCLLGWFLVSVCGGVWYFRKLKPALGEVM